MLTFWLFQPVVQQLNSRHSGTSLSSPGWLLTSSTWISSSRCTHLGGYWSGLQRQDDVHDACTNAGTFQQDGDLLGGNLQDVQLEEGRRALVQLFRVAGRRKDHSKGERRNFLTTSRSSVVTDVDNVRQTYCHFKAGSWLADVLIVFQQCIYRFVPLNQSINQSVTIMMMMMMMMMMNVY